MPDQILPTKTAGIHPEQFSDDLFFAGNKKIAAIILAVSILIGFGLRVNDLGTESLGEDELNKLETVKEYRENGLSGKNGEHPFLMKGLQTVSIIAVEKINSLTNSPGLDISEEAALRFPVALFGSFTTLLIFLLMSELFGRSIALVSAMLWAVEPMAIGFDRIAKEDSLVLFFFLLTMLFWIRGQTSAERGKPRWTWYAWAAAASFAGLMASKYLPHLLAVVGAYYIIFQYIPATKWRMERARWLKFFAVMGFTFLILNPTIMLPETWREMLKFSSENRIGHDSYESMGALYINKMTAWLAGVPWTFYYVFIAVKTSLPVLALFLIGLPMMFKRRLGDGRFFLFFWAFMWFMPFTFLGGKFTRYFTFVEPLLLIAAAATVCALAQFVAGRISNMRTAPGLHAVILLIVIGSPLVNSLLEAPHYRLFTNNAGTLVAVKGSYFPHDEFYDASTREIVASLAVDAASSATVAVETLGLFEHYAKNANRDDLRLISLSDKNEVRSLASGDYVVVAKGRRYVSNSDYLEYLSEMGSIPVRFTLGNTESATLYRLDESQAEAIRKLASRP